MSEYYIFELSENVTRTQVRYKNRYGIELAGDLYRAKNMDEGRKYPALVIGAPYGGVKEQGPGVYANVLAQRGFVVLTFDPSFKGESGGEPRHVSSPEIDQLMDVGEMESRRRLVQQIDSLARPTLA